jgi:hypothetical protein
MNSDQIGRVRHANACVNRQILYRKGKGKFHTRAGHEDQEGEQMYSSTLPSTSALDGGVCSTPRPGRFTPAKDQVFTV